jgi:hypothetical protein
LFDFPFVFESQFLFDFDFDGKTMGVPARFAMNLKAPHGLVSADEILNRSSENVVDTGFTVRRRRTFVEGVIRGILARFDAFFKDSLLFPVGENLFLEIRQTHFVGYRFEHPANVAYASVSLCLCG